MNEVQELLLDFREQLHSAWRYRWYGMAVAWTVALLGWGVVTVLPDIHEGTARIYVDTSSVLEPVLGNQIISTDVEAQMAYIRESLLSRSRLDAVASATGLHAGLDTDLQRQRLVDRLRTQIEIGVTNPNPNNRNASDRIYSLRYENSDRNKAVGVVRELIDSFVADALGETQRGGDTAERFLNERVREYEQRLEAAEQALAQFKKDNAGRLPGAQGDYFQVMQAEEDALAQLRRDLRILEAKRAQYVEQLDRHANVVTSFAVGNTEPPPNSLDARIREYQAQLDEMLLEFTERHPDVIATRQTLEKLREERAAQLAALGLESRDVELLALESNPVYQALQIALSETEIEIATMQTELQERSQKVVELQGLIDEVPLVEAELARLDRDYEVIRQQYLELVRRRETQDLTRKVSDTDQIDFRVIDPPAASLTPVWPNRPLFLQAVLVAAMGLGGVLCYILAQLNPVFSSTRVLRRSIEAPVFGVVTHAFTARFKRERRIAVFGFAVSCAALVLALVVLLGIEVAGPGLQALLLGGLT